MTLGAGRRTDAFRCFTRRPALRGVAFCALAALLSGCVLDRVFDTHDQLCKASPPEVVITGGAGAPLRVVFERPTMTRDDVEWLVGLPPTRVITRPDGVRLQFAAAPAERPQDDGATLVTELRFVAFDGTMKLAESIPPPHVAQLLPRELIDRAVAAAWRCHWPGSWRGPSAARWTRRTSGKGPRSLSLFPPPERETGVSSAEQIADQA